MSLVPTLAELLEEVCDTYCNPQPDTATALSGGPVHLRLHCAHAPTLTALASAFAPYLRAATAGDARPQEIGVLCDAGLARRLEHPIAAAGGSPDLIEPHLSREGVHLVRKQSGSRPNPRPGYLLWRDGAPGTTYIVLPATDSPSRTLLKRMVRAIAARTLLAAGWIPLHAACVTTSAGAVCLLGGQGGGKTTALLRLLSGAVRPVAFVANDKVFLSPDGAMEVRALPTAVGLRAPTIRLFPALSGWAPKATSLHDDDAALIRDSGSRECRTYLPADRVAEAFAVNQAAGGTLAALVDVAYLGRRRSAWRLLAAGDCFAALHAAYLSDGLLDDPHENSRLHPDHARAHRDRLQRCAEALPAAAFEPGDDAAHVLASGMTGLLAQVARNTLP